ncbi:hypothetical protein [Pseudomonas coronafaciens]|uniref:Uncharacterized protein n=1 Tax=Pseudomonas coronafaciens pv. coronafaciens TaxID=235275 RepID=A0AAE6QFA6_9PSED|nr:hypothetical protein [Pseudomonas coronafaciens]QGT81602.1 hypothetical protein GMO17_10585 [Pseudomonas coronafaciens pv. coronafaciens]QIQ74486.1 hypothetical protein HBB04_04906 [Pseudomonas coronafaciens]
MANKTRFYKVTARNGHGNYSFFVPAHSESDLRNTLVIPQNELLIEVIFVGFIEVASVPDEENNAVEFRAYVADNYWNCFIGQHGYSYLVQQFSGDVTNINNFYQERDADRYEE